MFSIVCEKLPLLRAYIALVLAAVTGSVVSAPFSIELWRSAARRPPKLKSSAVLIQNAVVERFHRLLAHVEESGISDGVKAAHNSVRLTQTPPFMKRPGQSAKGNFVSIVKGSHRVGTSVSTPLVLSDEEYVLAHQKTSQSHMMGSGSRHP